MTHSREVPGWTTCRRCKANVCPHVHEDLVGGQAVLFAELREHIAKSLIREARRETERDQARLELAELQEKLRDSRYALRTFAEKYTDDLAKAFEEIKTLKGRDDPES